MEWDSNNIQDSEATHSSTGPFTFQIPSNDIDDRCSELFISRNRRIEGSERHFRPSPKSGRSIEEILKQCDKQQQEFELKETQLLATQEGNENQTKENTTNQQCDQQDRFQILYIRKLPRTPRQYTGDELPFKPTLCKMPGQAEEQQHNRKIEDKLLEQHEIAKRKKEELRKTKVDKEEEEVKRLQSLSLTDKAKRAAGSNIVKSLHSLEERRNKSIMDLKKREEDREMRMVHAPEIDRWSEELSKKKYKKDLLNIEREIRESQLLGKDSPDTKTCLEMGRSDILIAQYGFNRAKKLEKAIKQWETPKAKKTNTSAAQGEGGQPRYEMLYDKGIQLIRSQKEMQLTGGATLTPKQCVNTRQLHISPTTPKERRPHTSMNDKRQQRQCVFLTPRPDIVDRRYDALEYY